MRTGSSSCSEFLALSASDDDEKGDSLNYGFDVGAAMSGPDCWGLQFSYDIWANLLSASTTKCSPPNLGVTINAQNRIAAPGYQYDAAGNLTNGPGISYQYDAENRMKSVNTSGATYTYDASGNRVRKQVGSNFTEYLYFGGQVIGACPAFS
jgi:YD repeat-containing protein